MSRRCKELDSNITVVKGTDQTLGFFMDIIDKRFISSGQDEQGEGYVFEWSDLFSISNNRINLQLSELFNDAAIIQRCNEFIDSLKRLPA